MAYEIVKRVKVKGMDIEFSNNAMYVYSGDLKLVDAVKLNVNNLNSNTSEEVYREIIKEYLNK